jgi:hypothetical protein
MKGNKTREELQSLLGSLKTIERQVLHYLVDLRDPRQGDTLYIPKDVVENLRVKKVLDNLEDYKLISSWVSQVEVGYYSIRISLEGMDLLELDKEDTMNLYLTWYLRELKPSEV